jgi:hypothetical protein
MTRALDDPGNVEQRAIPNVAQAAVERSGFVQLTGLQEPARTFVPS